MASLYQAERPNRGQTLTLPFPESMACCIDEDCPHPFGLASECLLLKLKEETYQQRLNAENYSNNWKEKLDSPNPNMDITEQVFLDRISNSQRSIGNEEDDFLIRDDYDSDGYDADIDSETRSFNTIIPYGSKRLL